jgi:signal transduction histidine kinase
MNEQFNIGLLTLAGTVILAIGTLLGVIINARSQRRVGDIAAKAATDAAKQSAEQLMIDQLQEELQRYREQTDQRLERLETENRAYRDFIFIQRDHMKNHGVTPPPWPDTLPR